jgi:CTP synthase
VHVVYLPFLGASQETKTKPAQNSVRDLRGLGISPDILVARSEQPANQGVKRKLSLFTGVDEEAIALLPNAPTIYEVPLTLEDTGIADVITERLQLKTKKADLTAWRDVVKRATTNYKTELKVGVVAKYLDNTDTYMSVFEALRSAAWWNDAKLDISWIDAERFDDSEEGLETELSRYDGIVVPGGFGQRGLEGKIKAAQYALRKKQPYLGLCLGLQMAVIASARNAGLTKATTFELDADAKDVVINTMSDQKGKEMTGGTMRLGNYDCELLADSIALKAYGTKSIIERHRHRGECNNDYRDKYEQWGIRATGINRENNLVEVIEAIDHPFMVASQFHPEFKSRPTRPHPLFDSFMKALVDKK